MERRLAAILAADIEGYSRLMGADEAATLTALRDLNATVIGPCCAGNRGKVIKTLGDGWLMSFPSAVDAVNCAMQIQDRIAGHERFNLRIGIHAGDVIHDADDVFGDGVNIAARLEGECVPGEITVSDAVFISLDGTLSPSFDAAGERELKNIARPVRVWTRAKPEPTVSARESGGDTPQLSIAPVTVTEDGEDIRDIGEALTGDVDTCLGALNWLDVTVTASEPEPGVYCLQSRLRQRGKRLRLEARLAGPDGAQVWTGKFDGTLDDSFDWQDRTGEQITAEVMGIILDLEQARLRAIPDGDLTAAQVLLLGRMAFRNTSEETFLESLSLLSRAVAMQPDDREALGEAITLAVSASTVGYQSIATYVERVPDWVEAGRRLDNPAPLLDLGITLYDYMRTRDAALARDRVDRALRRAPSDVRQLTYSGWCFVWMGATQAALDCFDKYRRLGRFDPLLAACEGGTGTAHFLEGNDAAAIRAAERGLQITRGFPTLFMVLAAAHARQGDLKTARGHAAEYLRLVPGTTIARRRASSTYGNTEAEEDYFRALELAGIPPE